MPSSPVPSESSFSIPKLHLGRDLGMVALCLTLIGGFVAQAGAGPAPAPGPASAPLLAARIPLAARAAQDLASFAGGAAALYPPCSPTAAR